MSRTSASLAVLVLASALLGAPAMAQACNLPNCRVGCSTVPVNLLITAGPPIRLNVFPDVGSNDTVFYLVGPLLDPGLPLFMACCRDGQPRIWVHHQLPILIKANERGRWGGWQAFRGPAGITAPAGWWAQALVIRAGDACLPLYLSHARAL